MLHRRQLFVAAAAVIVPVLFAGRPTLAADAHLISAEAALEQSRAGALLIIDVRSPEEWRETGVPESAVAITIHQPAADFHAAIASAVDGDKTRPIALICARGGRSQRARRFLLGAGFTDVLDVSEGMLGSRAGPGWLGAGLPVSAWPGEK